MTTYTKKYKCFLHLFFLLMLALCVPEGYAQTETDSQDFVRESIIFRGGGENDEPGIKSNHEKAPYYAKNLLLSGEGTRYYSGNPAEENWEDGAYLEVTLKDGGLSSDDPNHLLIYVRRVEAGFENAHPTAFRVEGLFGNDDPNVEGNWKELFYVYLLYRGNYTQEYSSKVSIKKLWKDVLKNPDVYNPDEIPDMNDGRQGKNLTKLRFYVTANNNREYDPATKFRDMAISRFDVIKLSPEADYSDTFIDRFHLASDYLWDYKDFKFEQTQGIFDEHNKVNGWEKDKFEAAKSEIEEKNIDVKLPEFEYITDSNSDITLGNDEKRQPTHTIEHIIYALPGDVVALYPFYQLWQTEYYCDQFSHWYSYPTGGRLTYKAPWSERDYELLDFAIDPSKIFQSDKYGFYSSKQLNGEKLIINAEDNAEAVEQYIRAVEYINTNGSGNIKLERDLDFAGVENVPMLGTEEKPFKGFFNGNGHEIKNLNIYRPTEDHVGLISWSGEGGHIENLTLDKSCVITGNNSVGLIGEHIDKILYIKNIRTEAKILGNSNCGGLVGHSSGNSNRLIIENCYIGGQVGNDNGASQNAAIVGWTGMSSVPNENPDENHALLNRVIVTATVYGQDGDNYYFRTQGEHAFKMRVSSCEGIKNAQGFEEKDFDACKNDIASKFKDWKDEKPGAPKDQPAITYSISGDRVPGTYATFFCPRNPYSPAGDQHSLPFGQMEGHVNKYIDYDDANNNEKEEFVIAADFSQNFLEAKNIDVNNNTIYEPIISMRHLFRIRDGKEFADEFSGSAEKNAEYVRKHQRMVSARAGAAFQIRFDTPIPADETTRSSYYYKIANDDYRRVCSMDIRVFDSKGNDVTQSVPFKMGEAFKGQGSREVDGVTYELCGGGKSEYYRMLELDKEYAQAGNYIVQLIGKDVNNNTIKVFGSNNDLVVMEYNITFLPEAGASLLSESELYSDDNRFMHAREEVMKERYGEPNTYINFDEYMKLEELANKDVLISSAGVGRNFFKWPMSWEECNYSFGYNNRYDYNMYLLATNASETPFANAAKQFKANAAGDGDGLYDRLYYKTKRLHEKDETQKIEKGYFYYLNAATDPGVAARLNVNDLCMGSTIYVSAWVSEFNTHNETANLSFNFVAVMNGEQKNGGYEEGERVLLHSFISGYLPKNPDEAPSQPDQRAEWRNVYYSFVPRLSEFFTDGISAENVHHYELELDNNCKSSDGADYAIDDISVYVVRPVIYASQMKPMCDMKSARIKVESPFNTLLQTLGRQEKTGNDGEEMEIYYTFLDKDAYDKLKDYESEEDPFDEAVVKFAYDGRGENEGSSKYGKIVFNTNYSKNQEYTEDPEKLNAAMQEIGSDGERMIVFFSDLEDESFHIGKEYYVVLKTPLAEDDAPGENLSTFFDMADKCAKLSVFSIKPSNQVKVDGEVVDNFSEIRVCEGQSPVIQINLQSENKETGEYKVVERNAWFDWFNGTMTEFEAYRNDNDDNKDHDLETALKTFRAYYPDAAEIDVIKGDENKLDQWMIDLLTKATTPAEGEAEAKLLLRQSSYVFPPLRFNDEEKETVYRVVAIPIPVDVESENLMICTDPSELRIRVEGRAPALAHGLASIPYPEDMNDVPLRIGLDQIREYKDGGKEMKTVEIPVRRVAATGFSQGIDKMTLKDKEGETGTIIILVQTNDPEYKDLGTVGADNEETGALLEVGKVNEMTAEINGEKNLFQAVFDKDFNFKEGYYYRFRFNYQEGTNETTEEDKTVCDGQDVFTLKIVPRYLQWTGERGLNWNNDANWRRIKGEEMRNEEKNGKEDYLTDGKNKYVGAYAPLDFTSVIIPYGIEAPWLYAPSMETKDGFDWPKKPSVIPTGAKYADAPEKMGDATDNIQYDMAAYYKENLSTTVYCRPWYANTCFDIHFNAGSAIMNQHELNYTRAWADVELDPTRWYLLSTPFQEVYAGDFYLPSANARQETEYFKEIKYDETLNNRFRPAVYQRGWDKGSATVYEIEKSDGRNVALQTTWSHVYNDVKEQYGNGVGFSIKTDVSALGDNFEEDKVMFRLPKDDDQYLYYDIDGQISGHNTAINRTENHYRLNSFDAGGNSTVTISGASEGKIFLAGNPMMARLDIAGFMEANKDVIKSHLWIITEKGQEVVLVDENNNNYADLSVKTLSPFQGFFVEARNPADKLILKYSTSMMRRHQYDEEGEASEGLTRSGASPLRITAFVDGNRHSSALISPEGTGSGVMALDNRELGIESIVYSVNGESAMSVNFAPLNGREIGVIADSDTETLLRFENTAMAEDLYLYDNAEGSLIPIEEDMEYEVKGAVAGRLFITSGREEIALPSAISWKVDGDIVSVSDNASTGWLSVNVYDTLGRLVKNAATSDSSVSFDLGNGVYVMEIQTAAENKKVKFVI